MSDAERIQAIKEYRNRVGCSLREAAAVIDAAPPPSAPPPTPPAELALPAREALERAISWLAHHGDHGCDNALEPCPRRGNHLKAATPCTCGLWDLERMLAASADLLASPSPSADLARIEGMVKAYGRACSQAGFGTPTDTIAPLAAVLSAAASLAGRAEQAERGYRYECDVAEDAITAMRAAEGRAERAEAALWRCRAGDGCLCSGGPFAAGYPHSARCREWMAALTDEQRAALGPSAATCSFCNEWMAALTDEQRAALGPSAATCSFCNGEGVITRAFAEPHDVYCYSCSLVREDCVCPVTP